jgi:hypothetical protein
MKGKKGELKDIEEEKKNGMKGWFVGKKEK